MILGDLGLADQFDVVVTGEEVQRGKPDPEIFLRAAQRLAVPPRRCVVVGDAVAGIEAARRAGMAAIAMHRGEGTAPPGADLVIHSLAALSPEGLRRLIGGRQRPA